MKPFFVAFLFFLGFARALSQEQNTVITTAVPFLNIASDARSSGMGDVGVPQLQMHFPCNGMQLNMFFLQQNQELV